MPTPALLTRTSTPPSSPTVSSIDARAVLGQRDVGGDGQAAAAELAHPLGGGLQAVGATGADGDVGARLGEPDGERGAEAGGGAGDDGDLAVEPEAIEDGHAADVTVRCGLERRLELAARADPELAVRGAEVPLDGLLGHEQPLGDLAVAEPSRREPRDARWAAVSAAAPVSCARRGRAPVATSRSRACAASTVAPQRSASLERLAAARARPRGRRARPARGRARAVPERREDVDRRAQRRDRRP